MSRATIFNVLLITTSLMLVGCGGGLNKEDVQAIMASESNTGPALITEQYSCLTSGLSWIQKGNLKLSFKGAIVTKFSDGSMHVDVSYTGEVGEASALINCQLFNAAALIKKYKVAVCGKGTMISSFDPIKKEFTFGFTETATGSYVSTLKETVEDCTTETY